jgi:SAM-dependent methyltransferase
MEDLMVRLRQIPIIASIAAKVYVKLLTRKFSGSNRYWMERYEKGGNAGAGSHGKLAKFKAEVINDFVEKRDIASVIEFGCGDGNQLKLAMYADYLGFDISPTAIARCDEVFRFDKRKKFRLMLEYKGEKAELTLSLDVIYHLVEDDIFEAYMRRLFHASDRFVIIYSSNKDEQGKIQAPHIKHRMFTSWIEENISGWKLIDHIPNKYPFTGNPKSGSSADFFFYEKA